MTARATTTLAELATPTSMATKRKKNTKVAVGCSHNEENEIRKSRGSDNSGSN